MPLNVFIKESSEVSDAKNWVKKQLESSPYFHIDSIEGYTVNPNQGVSILMERAKVDYDEMSHLSTEEILNEIKLKDGHEGSIRRKLNLAELLGIPFHYLLYSDNPQHHVWLYRFHLDGKGEFVKEFGTFSSFGLWLKNQRTLAIKKSYGHSNITSYETSQFSDLPGFDQTLRQNQTPWLSNLDAFVSDSKDRPIALIEFQKTNKSPKSHCNNRYFQLGPDLKRFETLEIARVHSQLPLFILVWSENESQGYKIKRVECCTFPKEGSNTQNLHAYARAYGQGKQSLTESICSKGASYSYSLINSRVSPVEHTPPLSDQDKTFPSIYYKYKEHYDDSSSILTIFTAKLGICPECGKPIALRNGKFGPFLGCSSYPSCHFMLKSSL